VAHPQVAAFARLANGGQMPERAVYGQASKLSRSVHDIRYIEKDDTFVVANNLAGAIMTFQGGADGQASPIRVMQGSNIRGATNRLDVDAIHDEIFVPDGRRVLVYPRLGNGNIAPIRILEGPDTQIENVESLAVDPINDILVLGFHKDKANDAPAGTLLIFNRSDGGNVKPKGIIRGPNTGIIRINQMALYPAKKLILATMPGRIDHMEPAVSFLGIWTYDDRGNIAPKWKIPIGPVTTLKKVFGIAVNAKNKELIIADMRLNGVLTFSVPEIF
jgi:hypothetical protein